MVINSHYYGKSLIEFTIIDYYRHLKFFIFKLFNFYKRIEEVIEADNRHGYPNDDSRVYRNVDPNKTLDKDFKKTFLNCFIYLLN